MSVCITYFVHGTTSDNEEGRMSGWKDVDLSALGIEQNKALKVRLVNQPFDAVYTSDLLRAKKTADTVFGDRGIEIIADQRLRERNDGIHNGARASEVQLDEYNHIDKPVPEGESCKDVERRIMSLLTDLQRQWNGGSVAFVGHRFPQLALEVLLNGKTWEEAIATDWRYTKSWQPGWEYLIPDDWRQ